MFHKINYRHCTVHTYRSPCPSRRRHVAGPVEVAKVPVRGLAVSRGELVGERLGAHAVDGHSEEAAEEIKMY